MGAKRNGASIRRRILARKLRKLRERARLTLDGAAPALDSSASKLSRRIRQERLDSDDDPLQFVAIIDEAVLRNPVGGRGTQQAQMEHLLTASELPTVTLQLLPMGRGAHPSLASGFYILSFGDLGEPDMAYVEHALGATHLEKEPAVTLARLKFERLRTLALAPAESREAI